MKTKKNFVQLLDSLTSIAGVEEDAMKAWVEGGAVTGLEEGAVNVDLLQNLREVLGREIASTHLDSSFSVILESS